MHVVWHDYVAVEVVALAVEVMEGVCDDGMVLAEAACAVVVVEFVFDWEDKASVVLRVLGLVPGLWVLFEPGFALELDAGDDLLWERVGEAPSYEDESVILMPVG